MPTGRITFECTRYAGLVLFELRATVLDMQDWFRRLFMRGKYSDDGKHFLIDTIGGQKLYNHKQRERMQAGMPAGHLIPAHTDGIAIGMCAQCTRRAFECDRCFPWQTHTHTINRRTGGSGTIAKAFIIDILNHVDPVLGGWETKPHRWRLLVSVDEKDQGYDAWKAALRKATLHHPFWACTIHPCHGVSECVPHDYHCIRT